LTSQINKGVFGAITYIFSYLTNCINEMVVVLSILMIFDFITGITISKKNNTYKREIGTWGAIKKLFYIMILISGYLADISVNYFAKYLNLGFETYGSLGMVVIFYLIGNEGVSLYTNFSKLGLPAPKFLSHIFNNFKIMAKLNVPSELVKKRKKVK
jgi:toxin secretion/phage lysis holin